MRTFIFLFFISVYWSAYGKIHILDPSDRYQKKIRQKPSKKPFDILKNIERQNKKIEELLSSQKNKAPFHDLTGEKIINTGVTIPVTLLNSIVSSNLSSPILLQVNKSQNLPQASKVSCSGGG